MRMLHAAGHADGADDLIDAADKLRGAAIGITVNVKGYLALVYQIKRQND